MRGPKKPGAGRNKPRSADAPGMPWGRRRNETSTAWAAFVAYRDLGEVRSLSALSKALGKTPANYSMLCSKHEWVERCRAYDSWIDRESKLAEVDAIKKMKMRHVNLAMRLQGVAGVALRKIRNLEKMAEEGTLRPSDVRDFIDLGTKLERLNRDMPADEAAQNSQSSQRSFVLVLQEPPVEIAVSDDAANSDPT